jgi:hypothetical protein
LRPALRLLLLALFPLLAGCAGPFEEADEEAENTGAAGPVTTAPAWTRDPLRTTPSPGIREPDPAYGYTYGQPSGNRVAEGQGRLPESRPVDVKLGGEPLWVVGVPMTGDDIGWVAALRSGRLETFGLDAVWGYI